MAIRLAPCHQNSSRRPKIEQNRQKQRKKTREMEFPPSARGGPRSTKKEMYSKSSQAKCLKYNFPLLFLVIRGLIRPNRNAAWQKLSYRWGLGRVCGSRVVQKRSCLSCSCCPRIGAAAAVVVHIENTLPEVTLGWDCSCGKLRT